MIRALVFILGMLLAATQARAETIKVLILDDVFQKIPGKNERIEKMGKLKGDLLVNGNHYLGNIEVWKGTAGLYLINELPMEDYVKSVVSAEVGTSWEMEALKAQAVISRTYAYYQKHLKNGEKFDLTSSVLHQVYKGMSIDKRIEYAVMNTESEVLTFNGKLIEALYHSTSGDSTEDSLEVFGKSYPYLKPVETKCETSPYWVWERKIPTEEIAKALGLSEVRDIKITGYTSTKRAKTVDIVHQKGRMSVKATDLRKFVGWNRLPSTNFNVSRSGDAFVFEGRGYGHGVGLCQWTALEMARKGINYKEILAYFYPGTLIQLYENR